MPITACEVKEVFNETLVDVLAVASMVPVEVVTSFVVMQSNKDYEENI